MDEAALARVEEQRLELEGQISQLRKSLRHWQILEIDYEGLKEEFSLLPESCSTQKALEAAKDFAAELVDEQEIQILYGVDKGVRRTPKQVIDLLAKRIDYVSKNAFTIKKQLSDVEKKRNALLLAKEPDYRDEAGLPLTEVTEELDDDGNIVSSKLETAKSAAPQLMEVLKKVGVDDLIEKNGVVTATSDVDRNPDLNISSKSASGEQNNDLTLVKKLESQRVEPLLLEHSEQEQQPSANFKVPQPTVSDGEDRIVQCSRQECLPADLDNDSIPDSIDFPTNPNDTEEDAALRREMLDYAHSQIVPIVAQLELEENASDISYEEDEDQFSLDSDLDDELDEEEESEDEYGQTKNPVISGRYRRKMEELEKKLGLKGMQNLGPEPNLPADVTQDLNRPPAAEAARKAAIERAEATVKASNKDVTSNLSENQSPKKSKKSVSFAKELDIAQETDPLPQIVPHKSKVSEKVFASPVSGSVIERNPSAGYKDPISSSTSQAKKPSRFRAARDATPQLTTSAPPEKDFTSAPATKPDLVPEIMSAAVKERPGPSSTKKAPPPDSYDFDEALHKQEITSEYYKSRNKMIQRQGGFVRDGEDDNYGEFAAPLSTVDEETGKAKKISRFKAARLR